MLFELFHVYRSNARKGFASISHLVPSHRVFKTSDGKYTVGLIAIFACYDTVHAGQKPLLLKYPVE